MKVHKKQPLPRACCVVGFNEDEKVHSDDGDELFDKAFNAVTDKYGAARALWDDIYCEPCADRITAELNRRLKKHGYEFEARLVCESGYYEDELTGMELCQNCGNFLSSYIEQGLYIETYGELQKWERKCLVEAGEPLDDPKTLDFVNFEYRDSGRIVTQWFDSHYFENYCVVYVRNPYGTHNLVLVRDYYGNGEYKAIRHGNLAVLKAWMPVRRRRKIIGFLCKRDKRITGPYEPPRDGGLDGAFPPGDWERYQIKKALCNRYGLPEPPEPEADMPF